MTDTGYRTDDGDGSCRRCGRELLWAWLVGKRTRVPIDPAPSPAGELAVVVDHLRRLRARRLDPGEAPGPGERRATAHADSCPDLVERREAVASLRAARRAAPSFADPEALAEARAAEGARLAALVDPADDGRPAKRGHR